MAKITPHLPPWTMPKCKVLDTWEEPVESGTARGTRTVVKYLNKKNQEKIMTKWVRWQQ